MLYDRWLHLTRHHPRQTAVWDVSSRKSWTFSDLKNATDSLPADPYPADIRTAIAQPTGIEFILQVLQAWKNRQPFCPLDPTQPLPAFSTPIPPGIAHIKSTSATTGTAKYLLFTEEQVAADADQVCHTMGLRPEWPNLATLSMAHSYGFFNLITPLLLHGIPLILAGSPLPEPLTQAATCAPNLTLPAVPALWATWLKANAIPKHTRLAISAGSPLPLPLEHEIHHSCHLKIHNFYGATECGGIAFDTSLEPRTSQTLAGQPFPNVQLSIQPSSGCLQVLSAATGETHWPTPSPQLKHPFFQSSDLASIEPDGLHLTGRSCDTLHVSGRKVQPELIEEALRNLPGVADCAVFGIPDPDPARGDRIAAWIVPAGTIDSPDLHHALLNHLPEWQIPRSWKFVDALPRTHRGKLSRKELRALHTRTIASPKPSSP